jgi:hypothetical protein
VRALVAAAVLILALALAGGASAAPTRAQIDRLVAGFERFPSEAEVRELGPDVDAALIAYAEDPATSPLRALRAIAALRLAPSSRARAWLRGYVERAAPNAKGAASLQVAAALGALTPYGADSGPLFVAQLAHEEVAVRHAAAAALTQVRWPDARGPLTARLAVERDAAVAGLLRRALRALDESR